ncbi:YwqG family protein [Psychromonas aquimarina]|uniref:YwqG family protein n=1 Tax=Psychromonas aquimarina TaxID=444919 RepID=UPI0004164C14|nr:YwqG family protein [Psychromonas aquimarina]
MGIQKEIDVIIEKLKPHELETVKIKPIAKAPKHPWSSKFGGKAYWPKGAEYPSSNEGAPLFLLSQINFEDMPHLAGYPENGILQFFIENDDVYGLDFETPLDDILKKPNGYRVIYHPEFFSEIESDLPVASNNCMLPLCEEYSLSFTLVKELPSPSDYRFEPIVGDIFDLDEKVSDHIYENLDATGSKVGGYAYFTQEDPRSYEKTDENWLLLFQMDTSDCEEVDIMWGDSGVGNFFIKPELLSKCDFSEVWYNWDCC